MLDKVLCDKPNPIGGIDLENIYEKHNDSRGAS